MTSAEVKNLDLQDDECDLTNKLADQSKHLQFLRKQMVQLKHQLKNQKSMRDESQIRREQQVTMEKEELEKLNDLLNAERQKFDSEKMTRIQLQTELEKSKSQLDKEKSVREYYMKKEEEMSIVLLRLQEQTEMIHTSTNHQMGEMKKKEEKLIQEVWEAQHVMARLAEELQVEKNQNLVLRQKLQRLKDSHLELSEEYEMAVHKSEGLRQKLEMVINSHAEKVERDEQMIQQLQAEQEELRRAMEVQVETAQQVKDELERVEDNKDSTFLLGLSEEQHSPEKCAEESQVEKTNNSVLLEELERLTVSHQELSKECETAVQQSGALKQKLEMLTKSHEKKTEDDQHLIEKLRSEQEDLKSRIKELMTPVEVTEEPGAQELHEQDPETSREDHHSCLQVQPEDSLRAEDTRDVSCPVVLREVSEAKHLLPPVHRSMRRIRCFLGLRRKRQNTQTY